MKHALVGVLLCFAIAAIYWPVYSFDFVNFDDDVYLLNNPRVNDGLTIQNVRWAFTTGHHSNWHPVTWLSYLLDIQLFGLNPGFMHIVNVIFHAINAFLLYLLLARITHASWPSALAALLFALHPLHVESVAWISERKDVLSTSFMLLTLHAYVFYTQKRSLTAYCATVVLLALGLMAKPVLVTVPFLLLLLDYWPLKRSENASLKKLALEKVPLLALASVSMLVTYRVQQFSGAVKTFDSIPIGLRLSNGFVSYTAYLRDTLWPSALAPIYPFPHDGIPIPHLLMSCTILASVTMLCLVKRRTYPYLLFGWLWYLGALLPMIGFVAIGDQARADRYTYIPLIGIFVSVAWFIWQWMLRSPSRIKNVTMAATGTLAALMIAATVQISHWRNSTTLFLHAVYVTEGNYIAYNNLGVALQPTNVEEAEVSFLRAIEYNPEYKDPRVNLGNIYLETQRYDEAVPQYLRAAELDPGDPLAYDNLGIALLHLQRIDEATTAFIQAVRRDPQDVSAREHLGQAHTVAQEFEKALEQFRNANGLAPTRLDIRCKIAETLVALERYEEALEESESILAIDSTYPDALMSAGVAAAGIGHMPRAKVFFDTLLSIQPGHQGASEELDRLEMSR